MCYTRYVDVILQLIDKAGDFVSDDIWFRVVQYVTNNEDLQVTFQSECLFLHYKFLFLEHVWFGLSALCCSEG